MVVTFQILAILGLMACGYLARKRGLLSAAGTGELTHLLVALIYPALILSSITQLTAAELAANWAMLVMAGVIAAAGLVLGLAALRWLGPTDRASAGSFLFQCVFNNYLFLPLPLVLLLFGDYGVALLVFAGLAFEVTIWTLGVFLLSDHPSFRSRARELLNPVFITLLTAIAWVVIRDLAGWRGAGGGWLGELAHTFFFAVDTLGRATVAVSMLVAGSRMADLRPATMLQGRVWLVSVLRLVAVPLVVVLLLRVMPLQTTARGVLTVVAVMPCAVASVFFSERFGGDQDLIAGSLLLTHLWALVTVPLFLAWAL